MVDTRVPAAVTYALGSGPAETRATAAVAYALAMLRPDTRTSAAAVYAVGYATPCVTRRATGAVIVRRDGTELAFTDHDADIRYGRLFRSCPGMDFSAVENAEAGEVGNLELVGIIDDAAIREAELAAGDFDGARVEVWRLPWDPDAGDLPYLMARGTIGQTRDGPARWTAEMVSDGSLLGQRALLKVHAAECRHMLGDGLCRVGLGAWTVTSSVTGSPKAEPRAIFIDTARTEATGWFDYGVLSWTTGANTGRVHQVRRSTATGAIELVEPTLYPVAAGDTYSMVAGCDRRAATCKAKFANFARFGGFPHVPGRAALLETAPVK